MAASAHAEEAPVSPFHPSTARRTAVSVLAGGLLATTAFTPALAHPAPDPALAPVESLRQSSAASDIADVAIAPAGEGLVTSRQDSPVAPGVNHTAFERLDARGWLR
ncbi:MAG: hypothetical protein QOI21_5370, partial [Actinomycetota bacterium]|nr:hypothetical protein [Actinomycetota bacterium]